MNVPWWSRLQKVSLVLIVWILVACGNPSLAQQTLTEDVPSTPGAEAIVLPSSAGAEDVVPSPSTGVEEYPTAGAEDIVLPSPTVVEDGASTLTAEHDQTPLATEKTSQWQDVLDHVFAEMHTLDPTAKLVDIRYLRPVIDIPDTIGFIFVTLDGVWGFEVNPELPLKVDGPDAYSHPSEKDVLAKIYQKATIERSRMVIAPWQAYALVDQQKPATCENTSEKDFVLIVSEAGAQAPSWSVSDAWSVWYMECDMEYAVDMQTGAITLVP